MIVAKNTALLKGTRKWNLHFYFPQKAGCKARDRFVATLLRSWQNTCTFNVLFFFWKLV